MDTFRGANRALVLIDDDELSREVLGMMMSHAGFAPQLFESGEAALAYLGADSVETMPYAILTDMQMPGLTGAPLAARLREACGPGTMVLAMSGTKPAAESLAAFDGFLLKPFSAKDLIAACERVKAAEAMEPVVETVVLNETVYANFSRSMTPDQVQGLYKMCLDDAQKRSEWMRHAITVGDDQSYRRAAHAIKGGCGMVGALELASIASQMERDGLAVDDNEGPTPAPPGVMLDRFVTASERLERMLDGKARANRVESVSNL